ncbi:hypothetical protein Taro_053490 [Colocasia esculenta]|uniref:Uncharacterized protein n=1 Tax=Colocasia esculenta TaxID=4460 RepID=A0A843XLE3_COLES|nr:hypothetical protein [Colocasia esculenta]
MLYQLLWLVSGDSPVVVLLAVVCLIGGTVVLWFCVWWWFVMVPRGFSYHLLGSPIRMRLTGSVRGDERTRVMDSGLEGKTVVRTVASSRLQSSLGWSWTPRTTEVLPGAGQPVLFLIASLFVAPKPSREAWHRTVVQPNYGGCCCVTLCSCPHSYKTWRFGHGSRVRLLNSGRVHVGRRRQCGSHHSRC